VEGFDNKVSNNSGDYNNGGGFNKKSPSPMYNFKMQKEKENIASSKQN
jgi:hypothetical protein